MSECLLCKPNFKRQINYETVLSFVKSKEKYTCFDCSQKFVKKKGIVCSGCNKEISKKGLYSDCIKRQQRCAGNILDNKAIYQCNEAFHDLMVQYKRYDDYVLSYVLAESVNSLPEADYYVPIPGSPSHLRKGGSETIASIYQKSIPLTDLLVKADAEKAQNEKNRQERLLTKQTLPATRNRNIRGKTLLLDDIYATGRTLYHARDAASEAYPNYEINSLTTQQTNDQQSRLQFVILDV